MAVTASTLRQNVYQLLDQVLETGKPLEIKRKGRLLKVTPQPLSGRKLDNLSRHECVNGDPEVLVHCDWSREWTGQEDV
jgi:hypothetical protein